MIGGDYKEEFQKNYEMIIKTERTEFKEILKIASVLHEDYCEITGKTTQMWFFITVRPDEKVIDFEEFYDKVMKFTSRNCIAECITSFEQKGTNDEDIGKGFHAHILARGNGRSWRSKGECLRDTQSTFKTCTAPNCIQVIPTYEPTKIKQNYLIEYKSDDDHKSLTMESDVRWRLKKNLQHIYEGPLPPRSVESGACIKSTTGANIAGPFIISLD